MKRRFFSISKIISAACLLTICVTANAQAPNTKMGSPTIEELSMTSYSQDPEAKAVILWEDSEVAMERHGQSMKIGMTFKRRAKILAEEGMDVADVTIRLRNNEGAIGRHDELGSLKANAFNLVNGKIEKTTMTNATISKQRLTPHVTQTHFVIPQAKAGSIIEYQYKLYIDDFTDIPTWYAQCKYPVLLSTFEVRLPDWFVFAFQQTGSTPCQHTQDFANSTQFNTVETKDNFRWENIPALPKDNEYLYCPSDFADKVTCEMKSVNIPGVIARTYSLEQVDVNKQLLDNPNFGGRLRQKNPLHKEMEEAGIAKIENVMDRAKATIELLKKKVRWNGGYSLTGTSLPKVLKEGTGDNADLNFLLMSMLREVNVKCHPAVMSLRSRGRLPLTHSSLESLNTFCVTIFENENTYHFYDSSAEDGYFDVLPSNMNVERCIILYDKPGDWDNACPQKKLKYTRMSSITAQLSADGLLSGECTTNYYNNAVLSYRNAWNAKNDSTAFVASLAESKEMTINDFHLTGANEFSSTLSEQFTFEKQLDGDDRFYLNPLIVNDFKTNSFTAEKSTMPVEFPYITSRMYNILITLPEGYQVEEAIAPLSVSLPEKAMSAQLIVNAREDAVEINCRFNVNRIFYAPEEYEGIKKLYNLLSSKCNEMIVISKK